MSKKVIYKVPISRIVREVATFYVEADDSIDPDMVDETALAEAVYEAEAGEAACLWEIDVEFGSDRGTCTAERYTERKKVETLAVVRDTDCCLEANFKR